MKLTACERLAHVGMKMSQPKGMMNVPGAKSHCHIVSPADVLNPLAQQTANPLCISNGHCAQLL